MNSSKPTPVETVTLQTERHSQSEARLNFLKASSYPHVSFSTLVMAVLHDMVDDEGRRQLSKRLLENERKYELGTFIRCIQIEAIGTRLTFTAKTYDLESKDNRVNDHPANHQTVATVDADFDTLEDLNLNVYLIRTFFQDVCRVVSHLKRPTQQGIDAFRWQCYRTTHATKAAPSSATFIDILVIIKNAIASGNSVISFTTQSIVVSDNKQSLRWTFKRPSVVNHA